MYLTYKPLERSENEIRLLKIRLPERPSISDSFEFSTEPIRCQLSHASLDSLKGL